MPNQRIFQVAFRVFVLESEKLQAEMDALLATPDRHQAQGRRDYAMLLFLYTIRHTTAVHLLRAGVDINTIRAWLGHVSLETTNRYAEIDMEMKATALETCAVRDPATNHEDRTPIWRQDSKIMEFLMRL